MHTQRITRTWQPLAGALALVALSMLIAALAPALTDWLAAHHLAIVASAPTGGVLMASMFVPVRGKSMGELQAQTTPSGTMVVRGPLYDTQALTSGSAASLTFFNAINADKGLSNARGNGGALPAGTWFEPLWLNVDFIGVPVVGAGTALGMLSDINNLLYTARGIITITVGQTTLPQIPLSYCHSSGGPMGVVGATLTAPAQVQWGVNGVQDSGYCIANSWTLSPNTSFSAVVSFSSGPVITSTTPFLRVSFDGNWYLPSAG